MYVLNVEKRDEMIKAKKLKKAGMVPGCVYGGNLEETLHVQIPEGEARKLLKYKLEGGNVLLECEGKKFNVLLKEIDCNPVSTQIENLSFQNLVENKKVESVAQIVLKNQNKMPIMVQKLLKEIPYRALPSDLVEKIVIDLEKMRAGAHIKVKDLSIYQNPNIKILVDTDKPVLNITENSKRRQQSPVNEAV